MKTREEIIDSFETGLLSPYGDVEIRISGAIRFGEPKDIRYEMASNGYEPVGRATLLSDGSRLPLRWVPISAEKIALIEANRANMPRVGGFAPSFSDTLTFTESLFD